MQAIIESKLTEIPETMLIPLWARAEEAKRPDALLRDPKAEEMIRRIEYDFSKFRKAKFSQVGCCLRASLIDGEVKAFLAEHPDAVVIQLGAGLDARYERLQYPSLTHWYDLDVEEAIALRRQLLSESSQNTYISASMFDYEWMDSVTSHRKPVLIVVEGVLMYFAPEQVREFFDEVCRRFENTTVLFDMLAFSLVGRAKQHDSLKTVDGSVEFRWSLLDTKEMETWSPKIRVAKEYYMSDHDRGRYPAVFRLLYKIPYFYRRFNQRIVMLCIGGA